MTSQLGSKAITIHKLPKISRSKNNQAMKFCQLIKYNKRNISLYKSYWKWLIPDLSLYFKKALYETKAKGLQLSFNIFG